MSKSLYHSSVKFHLFTFISNLFFVHYPQSVLCSVIFDTFFFLAETPSNSEFTQRYADANQQAVAFMV